MLTQALQVLRRYDLAIRYNALIGFAMARYFQRGRAGPFAASVQSALQVTAGVAVHFHARWDRDPHRNQEVVVGNGGTQRSECAFDRCLRLLLGALGIGDLAGQVAEFA